MLRCALLCWLCLSQASALAAPAPPFAGDAVAQGVLNMLQDRGLPNAFNLTQTLLNVTILPDEARSTQIPTSATARESSTSLSITSNKQHSSSRVPSTSSAYEKESSYLGSTGKSAATSAKTRSATRTTATTTARASPSLSTNKSCQTAPASFDGTREGWDTICERRYCTAAKVRNMHLASSTGPVTRFEIETALGMLESVDPILKNGQGNVLADGVLGQAAWNSALLLEVTGDIRALDSALRLAENILWLRNDPKHGVVYWTGKRELLWPTTDPNNASALPYAGCEQGAIVSHMVYPAVFILKLPCLWDQVPPPRPEQPSPFNTTDTYLKRALALIKAGKETTQTYLLKHFLDPQLLLIQPNDTRWNLVNDVGNKPGDPMPYNRKMMMMQAFHRLAAAYETDVAFNPALTWIYDTIIRQNVQNFTRSFQTSTLRGKSTFVWNYVAVEDNVEESKGIHAYYDILGVWQAWQRNATLFALDDDTMIGLANTFQFAIYRGNNTFAGLVNGSSTDDSSSVPGLWGGWSFYAKWLPDWFSTLATANVESGFNGRSWLAIPLLWTKNALYLSNEDVWRGKASSGKGFLNKASGNVTVKQAIRAAHRVNL